MRVTWTAAALALAACGAGDEAPSAPGWTALAPMPVALGEIAVATDGSKIYVAGGYNTQRTFQIYDVAANHWEAGPGLGVGTDNAGAVFTGGKLFVFGGEATPAVQIYDVAGASWGTAPPLPRPRFASVVELVAAEVHLVGGWSFDRSNNVSVASHDVFDVGSRTYPSGAHAALASARNHAFSGVIDGKIYVTGGRSPGHEGNDGQNLAATEVYDPGADAWSPLADLPTPRSGGASAVVGGKLYVLGGQLPGNTLYKTVERFDPSAGSWQKLDDMPAYAAGQRAVAIGGDVYMLGGFASNGDQRTSTVGIADVWRYTPPP
jgi:N-acetylneuraminic acid mutarotase